MVYRNIENRASFSGGGGGILGNDDTIVQLESDEYSFVKTASPEFWSGEGLLTYTITLTNNDGEDLSDVTITDILPGGVTFLPDSVQINDVSSENFDDTGAPTILFGAVTPLEVTSTLPLKITFQVSKTTP